MRKVLSYIGTNLALIISFGLALAAMLTGEYAEMEFFLILGMFAVLLNEVHENRAMLRKFVARGYAFMEEEEKLRDD